jgi:hypothetical protein
MFGSFYQLPNISNCKNKAEKASINKHGEHLRDSSLSGKRAFPIRQD